MEEQEQYREERRQRKRQRKAAVAALRAEAEAPVLIGPSQLRYLRPFWSGPPTAKALHLDAPVCGSADSIEVIRATGEGDVCPGLIAVNKPAPLSVLRDQRYLKSHLRGLVKAQQGLSGRLSALHRLDICTSGVVIFATDCEAASRAGRAMDSPLSRKVYLARVVGAIAEGAELECTEDVDGKASRTTFEGLGSCALSEVDPAAAVALGSDPVTSLVLCRPWTGRTHQIRKHLQALGFPIANDVMYGGCVQYCVNTCRPRCLGG